MKYLAAFLFVVFVIVGKGQPCRVLLPSIDSIYEGECRKGLAHGEGRASRFDVYEGEFRKGLPHGQGTCYYQNGDVYSGSWEMGLYEGYGRYTPALKTEVLEGVWKKGFLLPVIEDSDWLRDYSVKKLVNVSAVNFRRTNNSGATVRVRFFRNSSPSGVYELQIVGTSGDAEIHSDFPVFSYVAFPFAARLTYKMQSTSGSSLFEASVEFVITQEGEWDVMVYH